MVDSLEHVLDVVGGERKLIAAARSGSAEAFDLLMLRYYDGVQLYLVRLVRDPNQAEDLAQDVFLAVHQKLHTLSDDRSFVAWLYRIAWNRGISHLRRQRIRQTFPLDRVLPWLAYRNGDKQTSDDETLCLHDLIQQVIDELSSAERGALLLHTVAGFNTAEVAEILGISTAAAGRRISRGKDHFRRLYAALVSDDDMSKRTIKHHD